MAKILIACEESQEVCKAFRVLGFEAYSNDILDCSGGHPEWHIKGYLEDIIGNNDDWDMIIAFPPCTHLAVSGAKHFEQKRKDGRQQYAINFFMMIANNNCKRIAIENPIGIMSTEWRKPDQIIQPWQFGEPFTKTTCLWLKGLPILLPTKIVDRGLRHITKSGKSLPDWYNLPPSEDRAKLRSKTFPGIAKAMAEQWSAYILNNNL
jgi:site-specific DNA-cytosine methylase